jgi:hypothetical protein
MTDNNLHGSTLQNDRADAGAAARSGAQIAEAVRQSATAVQQGGHVTNDAVRRGVEATAEITRQSTQASVEATRRAAETANETVRRSTQAVAEGQRQIAQEAAQTFQEVSRKVVQVAQGTSEEVRRLATLPHAAEGGLRDLQQGMAGLIEGVVQTNLRATQELFRLTNPTAIIELQQRFAREYLDTVMQNTVTLVRAVRRTADETLHPLEAQVAQRQQARPGYRTAAE